MGSIPSGIKQIEFDKLLKLDIISKYKRVMQQNLQASFPGLNTNELNEAIEWSILNTLLNHTNLRVVFSSAEAKRRSKMDEFTKNNPNSISIF